MENNFGPETKDGQEPVVAPLEKKKYTPLTPEKEERAEFELDNWTKKHPSEELPQIMRRDHKEEKAQVEGLLEEFRNTHSLGALHAITEITPELIAVFDLDTAMQSAEIAVALPNLPPEDAEKYKIRNAARNDFTSIFRILDNLQKKTTIPPEEYDKLDAELEIFSLAIGRINGGKVLHTR
jgi:hypothetical protein